MAHWRVWRDDSVQKAATVYMVGLVIFTFNLSTYGNREVKEKIVLLKGKKP